jgi:hypothetical protein
MNAKETLWLLESAPLQSGTKYKEDGPDRSDNAALGYGCFNSEGTGHFTRTSISAIASPVNRFLREIEPKPSC